MPRRPWDAQTKAMIVLEGVKGTPVAALCPAPQSRQALSDPWRDPVRAHAAKGCDDPQRPRKEARLAQENVRLKPLVGALTFELTKSDARLA